MACRPGCGACCIAPSITLPFYGMPRGKAAGEPCVHLDGAHLCALFGDPRRPPVCDLFRPEPAVCGENRQQALALLEALERHSTPEGGAGS